MLDVRATSYVSPLSEVEFASVPLSVRITNFADEAALIVGEFRVYNESTGLLIHSSDIAPFTLAASSTVDAPALTDWDPPAPADDVYFVTFNGHASNALFPHGIDFSLGTFHFDVKPVGMGPAPAAHHATHENGGIDEINLAGLSGLEHANLVGSDVGNDHPQYQLRHEITRESDCFYYTTTAIPPWISSAVNTGTLSSATGSALHPGVVSLLSSTSANSGYHIRLALPDGILIAGSEESRCWHRPQTLAGTTRHHGFHDATGVTAPVDGVWIWQDPADGKAYGRTRSNSVGSTTGTGYQLVTNTWYLEIIKVNAAANRVDFYVYNEAGTLLWTDSLTTNIPTGAGRGLAHGIVVTNSGTTAVTLDDVDYIKLYIPDRRPTITI